MRRFVRTRTESGITRPAPEHCELCSVELPRTHRHLLEMTNRRVVCACDPCAMRFHDVIGGRFKLIPRDPRVLPKFKLSDAEWENLSLPIDLAFFFFSSLLKKVTAMYPGPAGATESLLPLTACCRQSTTRAARARRRGTPRQSRWGDSRVFHRADRCVLRTGRNYSPTLARAFWRRCGMAGDRALLHPASAKCEHGGGRGCLT